MTFHGFAIGSGDTLVEGSDDGLLDIIVEDMTGILSKPETEPGDRGRPREDGEYFGRDRLRGRNITIKGSINTYSPDAARAVWRRLAAAWDAPDVRGVPGMCVPLRITYAGQSATVYGRPRPLDPRDDAGARSHSGAIPFVCEFKCVDHLFYGAEQSTGDIPLVAAATSGITWPTKWPLRWSPRSASGRLAGQFDVGPGAGAWLQATVLAPGGMVRPVIEVENVLRLELDMSIPADITPRFVTVIASPWARSVLLDGVTDVAHTLTPASGLLKRARIPPGPQQAILRGTDPTGTARLRLSWRDATTTL